MTNLTDPGVRSWVETADGLRLSVREWGTRDGPELLLIHGQAQCHLCFAAQIASPLLAKFRLVAFDQRGHGESARPPGAAPYAEGARFGDDIARVIRATGLRRPVAVGWSMGGRVLREYLIQHGDAALGGIGLVGSRVLERPEFVSSRKIFWQGGEVPPLAEQIAATAAFLRTCYRRQPAPEAFTATLAYNMLLAYEARSAISAWKVDLPAATKALQAVRVPTMIFQGTEDALVPQDAARLVADTIPGARLSWYEGCGHSPFEEDPERFTRELAEFVLRAAQSPAPGA